MKKNPAAVLPQRSAAPLLPTPGRPHPLRLLGTQKNLAVGGRSYHRSHPRQIFLSRARLLRRRPWESSNISRAPSSLA
jgi:hypothetical protein